MTVKLNSLLTKCTCQVALLHCLQGVSCMTHNNINLHISIDVFSEECERMLCFFYCSFIETNSLKFKERQYGSFYTHITDLKGSGLHKKPERKMSRNLPGGTQIPGKILRCFALRVNKTFPSLLSNITATPESTPLLRTLSFS